MTFTAGIIAISLCFIATGMMLLVARSAVTNSKLN